MDINSHSSGLEHQRTYQNIALELSKLGLSSDHESNNNSSNYGSFDNDEPKKSANYTESVHVPSSEHVAEIVGRQGKAAIWLSTLIHLDPWRKWQTVLLLAASKY